jgi:mycofactocin system FadH/OYE family oxidoreductase 2
MITDYRLIFTPLQVGPVTIKNRIMFTAHSTRIADTLPGSSDRLRFMGERYACYQGDRARGGAGLIICGQASVHPAARMEARNTMIAYDSRAIPGFKVVTDRIHQYSARTFLQLMHSGLSYPSEDHKLAIFAPSAHANLPYEPTKSMEVEDIDEVIEGYGRSAENAKAGGFDGIEIHSTHGYLPLQFLSPALNRRSDEYGGSLDNRMKFILRVIDRIKEVTGDTMALGVRLCGDELMPGGLTIEDAREIAVKLENTGNVDYISISIGNSASDKLLWTTPPMYIPSGYSVYASAAIKEAVDHIPVFITGRILDPMHADRILSDGHADMIGMTRAQIADPELAKKSEEGRIDDIRPCIGCNQGCGGNPNDMPEHIYCVQNPAIGREKELGIGTLQRAARMKKVLVVGGGAGGMETAWVAAARGHRVTLYEKTERLGGQINLARKLPGRDEMEGIVRWRIRQMAEYAVKVVLNQEVTAAMITREAPDAVVIATGSKPFLGQYLKSIPPPQGWEQPNVVSCEDILEERITIGDRVIILDVEGRIKGLGTADMLAVQGKNVELVTPLLYPGACLDVTSLEYLKAKAAKDGVKFTPDSYITKISGKSVTVVDLFTGKEKAEEADSVVIITCGKPDEDLYFSLKGKVKELYRIGDCLVPRTVDRAVFDGHRVGRML